MVGSGRRLMCGVRHVFTRERTRGRTWMQFPPSAVKIVSKRARRPLRGPWFMTERVIGVPVDQWAAVRVRTANVPYYNIIHRYIMHRYVSCAAAAAVFISLLILLLGQPARSARGYTREHSEHGARCAWRPGYGNARTAGSPLSLPLVLICPHCPARNTACLPCRKTAAGQRRRRRRRPRQ